MSLLIELPNFEDQAPEYNIFQTLFQQVNVLLHHPQFNTATIMKIEINGLTLSIPKGQITFFRDTRWTLEIKESCLRIWMSLIDLTGLNLVRAQSQRMKLELMILLRFVNGRLPIEQQFFVDPFTGVLRYSFIIAWKDYREKIKGMDPLRKLFRYLLSQLHLYAEVILFCQPQAPEIQIGAQSYSPPRGLQTINRYRFFLRNTRKFRESNMGVLEQITELKNQIKGNPNNPNLKLELNQLRMLFQGNILAFEQMRIGLEDPNSKKLQDCLRHIIKAAQGQESLPPDSNIVSGLKVIRSWDIRSISREGAHSQIKKGKFIFKLYKTINEQTILDESVWSDGKENKAQLMFKSCNQQQLSSINSFMNEICLLNYIRDCKSSSIAKYYLPVKKFENRNEHDYIYMKPYVHNLYVIVKKCKTLSFEERLNIAYKISKGFCFLTSRAVLHRDFKPQNIMIDQFLNPFIIDFGSCAPVYRETNFKVREERLLTTPLFHIYYHELPEEFTYLRQKFTREEYNRHPLFDVYSFGRVLSFIFFNSLTPPNIDDIVTYSYPELQKNILFVITLCLQVDPDERPTFSEISSFLGTLKSHLSAITDKIEERGRSFSEPKSISTSF